MNIQEEVCMRLLASSCFGGEVCPSPPCACAQSLIDVVTEHITNGPLHAAAPEMLAALRKIVSEHEDFRAGLPDDWEGDPLSDEIDSVKQLIAKIEGRERQRRGRDEPDIL